MNLPGGELGFALARTFAARVVAAVGTLLLGVVVARFYGASGVGAFAIVQGLLLGGAIVARYGMDNTLMLHAGRSGDPGELNALLRRACGKAARLGVVLALLMVAGAGALAATFSSPTLQGLLVVSAPGLPAFTLSFLFAGLMRGLHRPATAALLENGSVSLLAACLVPPLEWLRPGAGVENAGIAFTLSAWIVLLQGWLQLGGVRASAEDGWSAACTEFDQTSREFFIMSLSGLMQGSLGMLIAGYLMSATDLGLLKSAQQTAVLASFILVVMNSVYPPRFARLYQEARHEELDRLARQGALLSVVLASPLLLAFIFLPSQVLRMYGEQFTGAGLPLQIIALGQLVNVATGSVGFLLNMTGHVVLMRNITLVTNFIGLALFYVLIPLFGMVGGALSMAFVLVAQNLVSAWYVWKCLRIWTLPLPNFLE